MQVKAKQIDAVWAKFRMKISDTGDRHALLYDDNGNLILRTKRSHGSGKLDGNISNMIRQQMKLNLDQFRDAVDCTMQRDGYLRVLKARGIF